MTDRSGLDDPSTSGPLQAHLHVRGLLHQSVHLRGDRWSVTPTPISALKVASFPCLHRDCCHPPSDSWEALHNLFFSQNSPFKKFSTFQLCFCYHHFNFILNVFINMLFAVEFGYLPLSPHGTFIWLWSENIFLLFWFLTGFHLTRKLILIGLVLSCIL